MTLSTSSVESFAPALPLHARRQAVNIRSLTIGLLGAVMVCGLAAFNDYVLDNSVFVGGSMPVGVMLFMFLLVTLVNAPLWRYAPRHALSSSELAVILTMMLVSCVLPTTGLMGHWPAAMVGPWYHMRSNPQFRDVIHALNLPDWFWPAFLTDDPTSDPVVSYFWTRIPADEPASTWRRILAAWIPPTIGWSIFFAGMGAAVLGGSFVVARQWIHNERIAFPIAQIQCMLLEQPSAGRALNSTLSTRSFWIAMGTVFLLRLLTGLRPYFPRYIPEIPMSYALHSLFEDGVWKHMDWYLKGQTLYLIIVALTFFVSTRIAFSLWFVKVLIQPPLMVAGTYQATLSTASQRDLNLGAILAFALMILWTGRHHYANTLRWMVAPRRAHDDPSVARLMRFSGWLLLLGTSLATAWLIYLGMTVFGALLLVGGILLIWMVMANVVAHSGMLSAVTLSGPREWFVSLFPNAAARTVPNLGHVSNHFFCQTIGNMWAYAPDQLGVYTTNSLRVTDEHAPKAGWRLVGAMLLALSVGFIVAETSNLLCYYSFATTADKRRTTPINSEVLESEPKATMNSTHKTFSTGWAPENHSAWPWVAGGFGTTATAAFMQLRYTWWPLHPIGFLMVFSYPMRRLWFSILVGWLVKVLIVRYGGARFFMQCKPFFMGIIIAEVVATGLFGLLAVVLYLCGVEYNAVNFLPVSSF